MEGNVSVRSRTGWRAEETNRLFSAIREAADDGTPLRSVFERLSDDLGRKPNSIRNYYYAQLREHPDPSCSRAAPFSLFTPEETHELLRQVLMARGQGMSVRSCVMRMAQGDHSRMLRYQNKYRTLLRHRPEMIAAVCEELRLADLPYPQAELPEQEDPAFCDPEDAAASRLMAQPCVSAMLDGLKELLRRAAQVERIEAQQRQLDRMQVQQDLRRIAWEKDFTEATDLLTELTTLIKDFLTLPRESQLPQLSTFTDAALETATRAERFLQDQ